MSCGNMNGDKAILTNSPLNKYRDRTNLESQKTIMHYKAFLLFLINDLY